MGLAVLRILVAAMLLTALAAPAGADGVAVARSTTSAPRYPDGTLTASERSGTVFLRVDGIITEALETRLLSTLAGLPATAPVVVELDSPGGFTTPGYRIIDRILNERRAGRAIATSVRAGESCESMCVGIYLAGYPRYAAPTAEFMVHAPRIAGSGHMTVRSTRDMVNRLRSLGASSLWLDRVRSSGGFSGASDHRETAIQLAAEGANVVTDLVR